MFAAGLPSNAAGKASHRLQIIRSNHPEARGHPMPSVLRNRRLGGHTSCALVHHSSLVPPPCSRRVVRDREFWKIEVLVRHIQTRRDSSQLPSSPTFRTSATDARRTHKKTVRPLLTVNAAHGLSFADSRALPGVLLQFDHRDRIHRNFRHRKRHALACDFGHNRWEIAVIRADQPHRSDLPPLWDPDRNGDVS